MSRLMDPKKNGSFPFKYAPPLATDVRSTWDRLCPGWRDRKPGPAETNVRPIQRTRKS